NFEKSARTAARARHYWPERSATGITETGNVHQNKTFRTISALKWCNPLPGIQSGAFRVIVRQILMAQPLRKGAAGVLTGQNAGQTIMAKHQYRIQMLVSHALQDHVQTGMQIHLRYLPATQITVGQLNQFTGRMMGLQGQLDIFTVQQTADFVSVHDW